MTWDVEGTDEFDAWFVSLNDGEQEDVIAVVDLLSSTGRILASRTVGP